MRLLLLLLLLLGGYGVMTGALAGVAFRRARHFRLTLVVACLTAMLVWGLGWAL